MALFGLIPDSAIQKLEADGLAIEKWAMSEADKIVAFLKQDKGLVGVVASAIALFEQHGDGMSGGEKAKQVAIMAVPAIVKVLTSGQSAFAVIETEIMDLAHQVVASVFNDAKANSPFAAIVQALGL